MELLKVAETRYASNFVMLRRLVEVKHALVSMVVSQLWIEWRQADSERGSMVRRLCLDLVEQGRFLAKVHNPCI